MLIQHLLAEHPFATKFDQSCKALAASCSHLRDTDGKLVYPVKGFGEKAVKAFEELMVFVNGYISHVPLENVSDNAEEGIKLMAGLEDLFEIISIWRMKRVWPLPRQQQKNEDQAGAEALRYAPLGKLTAEDKQ